jgi:hypothetical protein
VKVSRKGARMASAGRELLGKHSGEDHLTYEQIEGLGLRVVTEDGRVLSPGELRRRIFRIVDQDEPSGYVVRNMETTGTSTVLCYLQAAS